MPLCWPGLVYKSDVERSESKWPNDGKVNHPNSHCQSAESIPGCMCGANLVIPVQIWDKLSCGRSKNFTDGRTGGRVDGRTGGQTQATITPLQPERSRCKNDWLMNNRYLVNNQIWWVIRCCLSPLVLVSLYTPWRKYRGLCWARNCCGYCNLWRKKHRFSINRGRV